MLERVVERAERIVGIDAVVVATSTSPDDDPIAELCRRRGWSSFRGALLDVLDRYVSAANACRASNVLRITADCPVFTWEEAGRVVRAHSDTGGDCTHNLGTFGSGLPLGTAVEAFTTRVLEASAREGREPRHREHVDEYVYDHPDRFRITCIVAPPVLARDYRLTVDEPADLELIRLVYDRLGPASGVSLQEVISLLDANPELARVNAHVVQETA